MMVMTVQWGHWCGNGDTCLVENLSSTQTLSLSSGSWEIQESDELQHSLHLSQQCRCRRHGPGRACGRGHGVGDQAKEEGEEATEIWERDEDGESDSYADGDGSGNAGAVRGRAVEEEDEEGAEDEEEEEVADVMKWNH